MIKTSILNPLLAERRWFLANRDLRTASAKEFARLRRPLSITKLGQHLGVRDCMELERFRAMVPVSDYTALAPWIDRVRSGEPDVMWPKRPIAYVTTSGTTRAGKTVPITRQFLDDYHLGNAVTYHRVLRRIPAIARGRLLTLGGPICEELVGEIPVGSITGLLYNTLPWQLRGFLALPTSIGDMRDYDERLYLIARLAILAPITGVVAVTPGSLLVLSDYLSEHARELVDAVATGKVRPLNTAPLELRHWLHRRLRPKPARSRALQKVLEAKGTIRPKDIWPMRGLCCYLEELHPVQRQRIVEAYGNVRWLDPGIVASEGRVSIGIDLDTSATAAIPFGTLVEFAPCNDLSKLTAHEIKETVLPHELEPGEKYTPVITTSNGFIRYHLPDVVQVSHKIGDVSFIRFRGRLDGSISATGEKVSDAQLRWILQRMLTPAGLVHGEWYVRVEWQDTQPHYVLHIECAEPVPQGDTIFETLLQQANVSYRRKREQRLLGRAVVRFVELGSLSRLSEEPARLGQSKESRIASQL